METSTVVVMVCVTLLLASAVAWVVNRNSGNAADADLAWRTKHADRLEIHPLSAEDHDLFAERWRSTQGYFVKSLPGAVSAAETLVEEVMRVRGYPVGDFDQRAAEISADHPRFVANYREAREFSLANQRGSARTEDLRQAKVQYRALFEDLLGDNRP